MAKQTSPQHFLKRENQFIYSFNTVQIMKKTLLTLACALLCSGAAVAQGSGVMYEGFNFTNVSPNGRWLTENQQGVMAYIFDSQTKENWTVSLFQITTFCLLF